MNIEFFDKFDFFTGVPDSGLKALCNYLMNKYGIDKKHHIIAANEGSAVSIAAGYYLATGKVPVVYMQNSGEGNVINPLVSLLNEKVYAIPMIFVIGWRGEPGIKDEPQHLFQGEITCKLLENLDVEYMVIDKNTTDDDIEKQMKYFNSLLSLGKQVAFVIKKDALIYKCKVEYHNEYSLLRETIIEHIVNIAKEDFIVSTTGKTSRELFEIRERNNQGHNKDFLTVGSMGHSSSIALGIALQKEEKKIWVIDGDGAALMHMGAMAVIGANSPENLIHIVINNAAHETVGGMPTVMGDIELCNIARACGYKYAVSISTLNELDKELLRSKQSNELTFIEVKSAIGARENLGRPTTTPIENKVMFMERLNYINKEGDK